ncbi:MAG TPA: hypothetical protein VMA95_14120 [Streptosporangiaceae bacterium]|nr:hypothetical protein [Streptosporangiaceae bacterium]
MPLDQLTDTAGLYGQLAEPAYWLVAGLEWRRASSPAEAALAVAPDLIPRDAVTRDTYQLLACADLYATTRAARVVFLSDLNRLLNEAGRSWASLGLSSHVALGELQDGPYPALVLTITERAHMLISDPAASDRWHSEHELVYYERELVRHAITDKLAADWSAYMTSIIRAGRLRTAT